MHTLKTPHITRRRKRMVPRGIAAVALAAAIASPAVAGASVPDDTAPDGSTPIDPIRLAWQDHVHEADPDSFVGGTPAGELAESNRVVAIGDSLLASTARRYGGEMCRALNENGWDVAVDAEAGRFVDFGARVVDHRLDEGFDVAVIMLGNNYGADPVVYERYLREIVEDIAPRPAVLITVALYRPNYVEVNEVIYDVAQDFDNVRVLDWETEVNEDPTLIGGDRLHLSETGRVHLVDLVAEELGHAPDWERGDADGECLNSPFTDDSAVKPGETIAPSTMPVPTTAAAPATTRPATTTPATTAPATTAAPETTQPAETQPPATQPPVTQPPETQPPVTQPPPSPDPPDNG